MSTDRTASGSASAFTSGYPSINYNMDVDSVTIDSGTTTRPFNCFNCSSILTGVNPRIRSFRQINADDASDNWWWCKTKNEFTI